MTSERILTLYEELDMTVEQIAEEESINIEIVKEYLLSNSSVYREKIKIGEEEITNKEYRDFFQQYKNLAIGAENETVKEKALRFLIEEKKGRNEARIKALEKAGTGLLVGNINLLMLQQVLEKAEAVKKKVRKVIELEKVA